MAVLERVSIGSLAQGAVPPGYTHTRSTTALYVDSDGLLKSAAINTPRRQWDATNRRWGYVGEGARTNLLLRSEEFDNAAWVLASGVKAFGSGSVVNATSSPDGSTTMDFICEDTSTGNHEIRQAISVTSGTTYCTSVFAKYGGRYLQIVYSSAQFGASQYATFDLQNGVVSGSAVGTASIDAVGGGVYRCSFAAPATATAGSNVYITISNAATGRGPTYTGDGSSGVYIWGAQLEAGPAPSSYIPTTTVAVTRGADLQARALTGPEGTALSTQGTMVVEFSFLGGDNTVSVNSRAAIAIDDGTSSNRHNISNRTGGLGGQSVLAASNIATPSVAGTYAVGAVQKVAYTWKSNDLQVSVNGSHGTRVTSSAATMPIVSAIGIASQSNSGLAGSVLVYGWTISDDHYPTDAALDALTTPTTNRNQSRLTLGLGLGL